MACAISQSWRTLLQSFTNKDRVVVMEFWLLLVELLQDYNVDCRNEAAKCVTDIMSHIQGLYQCVVNIAIAILHVYYACLYV